jgi:tetratricopeptide (TPR) repeat protein
VLTCAHVVAAALDLPQETQEMPQAAVRLDFPLVAPGCTFQAKVAYWYPQSDVAGLELNIPLPTGIQPAHLVADDALWGHHFRAFGFPVGHEDGVWASGVLRGSTATSWVQIEDVKETGYRVEPGFSGGPVWDETLDGIVGIVVAAERQAATKAAFVIPTQTLLAAWPALAQIHLDAQMEQLRARRDAEDVGRRARRERRRVVNLRPLDVTHTFKDRTREVQSLCRHLSDPAVRLVSVVGRGGMGKTALVSRVLADLEDGKTSEVSVDGIIYLSARSTGLGLERIYADIGQLLGEPVAGRLAARWASSETPLEAKVEYLLETLQNGLYVILLDNLEDVLTAGGDIADEGLRLFVEHCLAQPSGARLVVTSREEVHLPAAALPGTRCILLLDGLPEDDAIALLRDLDPQGDLGLHNAPEEELSRAAQFALGVPRALELLAGILHEDPTLRLSDLLGGARLLGEQVVERLVAEGYHRLNEPEQRVMEALAVFDRPVETTAIAYLLHPWYPGLNVQAALRRLVRGYFVSVNRASGEYSLHPLDRKYAYGQLLDGGEAEAYTQRELELRAAEFYASIRKPESEWKAIDDLAPQLAEFEHLEHAGDYDAACQVLDLIDFDHLYMWGLYARLVEMRERLLVNVADPGLQASNLGNLGLAYHAQGQVKRARKFYRQALRLARKIGDRVGEGRHLRNLGSICRDTGRSERAVILYRGALSIFSEIGNRREEGATLGDLGNAYHYLEQSERAVEFYEQALVVYRDIGDRRREGAELANLGDTYRAAGRIDYAIRLYEDALAIAREIGDRRAEGAEIGGLGNLYCHVGRVEQAIRLFEEALPIVREIGARRSEGVQLGHLGKAYSILGQFEQAIKLYEEALVVAREISDRRREVICLNSLGDICYAVGQFEQATEFYQNALGVAREIGYRLGEGYQLLGLGMVRLTTGKHAEARRLCSEACGLNMLQIGYRAALVLGIVLLYQHDPAVGDLARETFSDVVTDCRVMLDKTAKWYAPRYALATALVGQAICNPRWAGESARAELLAPALEEYRCALAITAAPGIVGDALQDLKLIRAAGIAGLEPVFELLENAEYKPSFAEDLPDILKEIE